MSRIALLVLVTVLASAGCARFFGSPEDATAREMLTKAGVFAKSGNYSAANEAYRMVIQNHKNTPWAATALFDGAMVNVAADNPQKDYSLALTRLDEFLAQYPSDDRAPNARNWRQTVKTLVEFKRDNDRLNKNIERLKQLDMRQEEKRLRR